MLGRQSGVLDVSDGRGDRDRRKLELMSVEDDVELESFETVEG